MMIDKITNHPYYCSMLNYSGESTYMEYETVSEFLDEFEDADMDYNLCFRFDIEDYVNDYNGNVEWAMEESGGRKGLYAEFFIFKQRKGYYNPIKCLSYSPEKEGERLMKYLNKSWDHMKEMWEPVSK